MITLDMKNADIDKYYEDIQQKEKEILEIKKNLLNTKHELAIVKINNYIKKLKKITNVSEELMPYEVKIYVNLQEDTNEVLEFEFRVVNKNFKDIKKLSDDFYWFMLENFEHEVLTSLISKEFSIYLNTDNAPLEIAKAILGDAGEQWYEEQKSMQLAGKLNKVLPIKTTDKIKKV